MERVRTGNVKHRETGVELFRIITMLIIVAHHYVVNSGLMTEEYVLGGVQQHPGSLYCLAGVVKQG